MISLSLAYLTQKRLSNAPKFLKGDLFYSMKELRVLAERWRVHYNVVSYCPTSLCG
jgi:hypothetical protein